MSNNYELYHYGIKGMKWGVRRYQNNDGSLTPAGKKRYYDDIGLLTEEGRKQRDINDARIYGKSREIKAKISKSADYKQAVSDLQKSLNENRESYAKARNDWVSGIDFKKMDYYQFKDAAYQRWIGTDAGKTEAQRAKALKSIIEKKVKETIGEDAFNQTVPELNRSPWTKNLGEDCVTRIFNTARYDNTPYESR